MLGRNTDGVERDASKKCFEITSDHFVTMVALLKQ